jgi:hypothetical protein
MKARFTSMLFSQEILLFALGMLGIFSTPLAKLAQFQFFFHFLFVATSMMRDIFAINAFHLCHRVFNLSHTITLLKNKQTFLLCL